MRSGVRHPCNSQPHHLLLVPNAPFYWSQDDGFQTTMMLWRPLTAFHDRFRPRVRPSLQLRKPRSSDLAPAHTNGKQELR